MSLYSRPGLPDIRDIMIRGDYDRFPSFVDIDTRLDWIERFLPYHDRRVYIRNNFDELSEIPNDVAKRLYRKIDSLLQLLERHKEMELLRIKEEYDKQYDDYLSKENLEFCFKSLSQLVDEYDLEMVYREGEMTLYEEQKSLVIVPFRGEVGVIKRTYLEIYWDERDEADQDCVIPLSEFLPQEIMDIPIDVQSFRIEEKEVGEKILNAFSSI